MKRLIVAAIAATCAAVPLVLGAGASAGNEQSDGAQEFVVLYAEGASADAAHAAITAAGGTIVSENSDVGVATVQTNNAGFAAAVATHAAIEGTAENRVVGEVPQDVRADGSAIKADAAESETAGATGAGISRRGGATPAAEPLADLQWDMQQIGATATGSYRYGQGKGVKVGILDTGVDATHPDIAPNFDFADSRNFTTDLPADANGMNIDGPCASDPDGSCDDPPTVDENGHGTHVASTIAAPINGIGIAGVAPQATIVNLRAGQDAGYFFLKPSLDALTYAGRHGIDVVNMSYYIDPWLFNCTDNPADSADEQEQQRTIIAAMQRALDFAWAHGVTLVSAAGNGATDYTQEIIDTSSPDYATVPGQVVRTRDLLDPDTCTSMPSEGKHVIDVSATGVSLRKAYYSDYGNGYIDVAAPGGDVYDTPDNTRDISKAVLAAYPKALGVASGAIDADGNPTTPAVVKSCDASGTTCGYYQYLQGTSMASPHAVGVAALIIGQYGFRDWRDGGKALFPDVVELVLKATANRTSCPTPATYDYVRHLPNGTTATASATCVGSRLHNGFYGYGVINAKRALGH